eukprot:TRINITY_DN9_c0_g1_i7.p1 TRINITY_DN9_c0_g1~~TRINITY_DN9_c0_g1_i7.p1  ORF type:complete len:456 (+),score=57.33 TRINITY_DN9_c0_g1_i7:66-1433(+)
MARGFIFLLALLVFVYEANGGRGYRGGYRGYKGYNRYKNKNSGQKYVTFAKPRCSSKKTWIQIQVVKPNGDGCPSALIDLVDQKNMGKIHTNKKGLAKVIVCGCEISLIVSGENLQPTHKTVSLINNKTGKEKVVVLVQPRCNFLVYFYNVQFKMSTDMVIHGMDEKPDYANDYDEDMFDYSFYQPQHTTEKKYTFSFKPDKSLALDTDTGMVENGAAIVSYQFANTDGESNHVKETGSGLAVGDENPVCINWDVESENEDTAKLKFMAKFQGSAEINRLKITGKNTNAALAIPPFVPDDYKFLVCYNTWNLDCAADGLVEAIRGFVYNSMGAIDADALMGLLSANGNCAWTTGVLPGTFLITVNFVSSTVGSSGVIDGGGFIVDSKGNFKTFETPETAMYTIGSAVDGSENAQWKHLCICQNAHTVKDVEVVEEDSYAAFNSIHDNSPCDTLCA